jgi:hypothetical protein
MQVDKQLLFSAYLKNTCSDMGSSNIQIFSIHFLESLAYYSAQLLILVNIEH